MKTSILLFIMAIFYTSMAHAMSCNSYNWNRGLSKSDSYNRNLKQFNKDQLALSKGFSAFVNTGKSDLSNFLTLRAIKRGRDLALNSARVAYKQWSDLSSSCSGSNRTNARANRDIISKWIRKFEMADFPVACGYSKTYKSCENTFLRRAASDNNLDLLGVMAKYGANLDDVETKWTGATLIGKAIMGKQYDALDELLYLGADANCPMQGGKDKQMRIDMTPIQLAANVGDATAFLILLDKANLSTETKLPEGKEANVSDFLLGQLQSYFLNGPKKKGPKLSQMAVIYKYIKAYGPVPKLFNQQQIDQISKNIEARIKPFTKIDFSKKSSSEVHKYLEGALKGMVGSRPLTSSYTIGEEIRSYKSDGKCTFGYVLERKEGNRNNKLGTTRYTNVITFGSDTKIKEGSNGYSNSKVDRDQYIMIEGKGVKTGYAGADFAEKSIQDMVKSTKGTNNFLWISMEGIEAKAQKHNIVGALKRLNVLCK